MGVIIVPIGPIDISEVLQIACNYIAFVTIGRGKTKTSAASIPRRWNRRRLALLFSGILALTVVRATRLRVLRRIVARVGLDLRRTRTTSLFNTFA